MVCTYAHPQYHTCSFFQMGRFFLATILPQLLLLTKSLILANNKTLSGSGVFLFYHIFPPDYFSVWAEMVAVLFTIKLLFSQCLATVLKTCFLNEWMRFSNLPFVCKACKIHKHFEYLKTNLTRQNSLQTAIWWFPHKSC